MPRLSLATAGVLSPHLNAAMLEFEIVSKPRRCAFLAQLAHESSQLTRWVENLNYSASRLLVVFPYHFGGAALATKYEHQPERIASHVYANRMGNGDERSGDGWRFRGRCPIGITGRDMYRKAGEALGLPLESQPELAEQFDVGFRVAAWIYAVEKNCNALADQLSMDGSIKDANTFAQITRRINGGTNGLSDRLNYFRIATQVLHGDEVPIADPAPLPAPIAPPTAAPQAASPAPVAESTEPDADLLDAAVSSDKTKALWPRLVKHASAGGTFLWALMEAHKVAGVLVLIVIAAGLAWLAYHNRKRLTPLVLKALK